MIQLKHYDRKVGVKDADYTIDTDSKFLTLVSILTPKFVGKWEIVLIEPKQKFIKDLLDGDSVPDWITVSVYLSTKKLDAIVLEFPKLQPKKSTLKDDFNDMIAGMKHLITESAKSAILKSVGSNREELAEAVHKLDSECNESTVTLKQVQSTLNYQNITYASDVMKAFLTYDANRWNLYTKLVHSLGQEIAYYALYKQAKLLLQDKHKYLLNQEVKNYVVNKVDAPFICYVYVLFSNSSNYKQLPVIMELIDKRCKDSLSVMLCD